MKNSLEQSYAKHIMKYLFYLSLCLFTFSVYGQTNDSFLKQKDSTSVWELLKYDAGATVRSVTHAYTSPLQWNKKDFKNLSVSAISLFSLSLADEEMNRFFQKENNRYPQFAKDFGFRLGKPQVFFALNAGIYGYGLLTKNEAFRRTSVLIISSAITAGSIQAISKTAFGRARPSSGLGYDHFNPFSKEAFEHSFPSGHTILSVTMAHAIAKQFDNIWLKLGIYSVGSITPITRLISGAHWLTDVTVGTVLSIVVVDYIDKFLSKKENYGYKKNKTISWNVSLSPNKIGLIGTF